MSLQPAFWLIVCWVYDFDAEAEEESVEEGVAQVAQVVEEHIKSITPDAGIAVGCP